MSNPSRIGVYRITTNRPDNTTTHWQARFRAPAIFWAKIAEHAPQRCLVASNQDGSAQLYTWNIKTGTLQRLTNLPDGQFIGDLAPDGQYVYYFQDKDGNARRNHPTGLGQGWADDPLVTILRGQATALPLRSAYA